MRVGTKRLVTLCTLVLALHSCAPPPRAAQPPPAIGPALWKVTDDDTTVYLFGTIHALPQSLDWYNGRVAEALRKSDTLVTEIAPNAATDPAVQQRTMAMAMLPPGKKLRAMLTPDQRVRYDSQLSKLGLPVEAYDQFEPWFAALTLSLIPLIKSGYSTDTGVEKVIDANAGQAKARDHLETIEYQLGLFDRMATEQQIEYLMATVDSADSTVEVMNRMVTEWAEGDAEGLAEIMNEPLTDPSLAEALLYARNRNWAQWIDDRMDKPGIVFIAVGAGHLAGTNSVQSYLAQRNIATTRVQ